MLPQKLDMLLAFKAISLSEVLTGSEKRILATILDHFNQKTGQCDPSLGGIAELLSVDRRTVMRAIKRAEQLGLFRKVRHGGNFHRNSYAPTWLHFRRIEESWRQKKREHRLRNKFKNESPFQRQRSHSAGGEVAPQTCPINNSHETCHSGSANKEHSQPYSLTSITRQPLQRLNRTVHVKHASSQEAARDAAQRRWDNAILKRFSGQPVYAQIVTAIDPALSDAATKVEVEKPGSGFWYVLEQLAQRQLIPSSYLDDNGATGGSP
jgi:DNA-binding MarR family transcriptional regulator